jgi:hypothetical protein
MKQSSFLPKYKYKWITFRQQLIWYHILNCQVLIQSGSFHHLFPQNLETVDEVMSDGRTSKLLHALSEEGTNKGMYFFSGM